MAALKNNHKTTNLGNLGILKLAQINQIKKILNYSVRRV